MNLTTVLVKWYRALSTLVLLLVVLTSFGQSKSNKGNEFWLGFMAHSEGTAAGMSLYITSDSSTSGTVSVPGQSWSTNFTVTANNLTVVTIPSNVAYSGCSDCIVSKGVKVTALKDVIVYAHHYEGNRSDATLVLPTKTLGKDYYTMGYEQSSSGNEGRNVFIIVASKDDTKVNITPSVDLLGSTGGTISANSTYQVTLDEGEIYQGIARYGTSTYDITGTHIEVIDTGVTANCRTVSVFSGSTYTRIGDCSGGWGTFNSGDNLFEQMFPSNTWGKKFVLVPALGRAADNFRFLASEDNTQVFVYKNGGFPDILYLDKGEFGEVEDVSTVRNVISNLPIMVAQFQKTSRCDGNNRVGDPSMTILNPLEQTLKDITLYSSRYYDIDNHYINVVIPTSAASSFRLDGAAKSFTSVPQNSGYSYAQFTVTQGNHRLTANQGFVATAYGEGEYESYGYAAGANVKDLTATVKMANSSQTTEVSNCIGRGTKFQGDAEYTVIKWEWDFGDGNTDTIQNPTNVYADTGTYNVRLYTYKEQYDGCSIYDSAFLEVKIYDVPEARMIRSNLCDSTKAFFVDSSFVPAPEEYSFTRWTINSGAIIPGRNMSYTFDSVGKYELFMEVGTKHYCRDTIRDSITISPRPVSNFTALNTCFKDSTNFTNNSTVLTGNIDSSLWEFGDDSVSINTNPSHYYANSELYYITLTSVSDSGCRNSYTDSIYKLPRFVPQFEYLDTCFGFTSTFQNTTILEGGNFTDTIWYTSEVDTFGTYNLTKTFASNGSYDVHLIMEQDSFCRDTFSQTISIHPLATPAFTFMDQCLGDSTTFTDVSTLSDGTYTLDWDFDDGLAGSQSIEKVLYTSMGTKDVTLTLTTDEGCETDTTVAILITNPQITSLNIADMCLNSTQDIYGNYSLGLDSFLNYDWTINNTATSSSDTFTYAPSTYGNRDVELTINTKNGCEIVYLDSFKVFDRPIPDFDISEVCENSFGSPVDNSSVNSPATIDQTLWYLGSSFVSNDASPTIPVTTAGNYFLKLVIETNEGCTDSIIKTFNVNPLPVADFLTGAQCFGDNTIFNDNSTIPTGSNTTFNWLIDGIPMNGASVSYTFPAVGDYSIQEIVTSAKGCKDTVTKDVPVFPLPNVDVTLEQYTGCEPFTINILNNSSITIGSIDQYAWDWGNGFSGSGNLSQYTYPAVGTYTIKVIATSNQGCIDSASLGNNVTVLPRPKADFTYTPDEPSILVSQVDLSDNSSDDATDWQWYISDGATASGQQATHNFQDSGQYYVELKVENSNGCRDSITKGVYVSADLFVFIPNAFSPNGDLINDYFGLGGLTQGVVDMKLEIYNRWGEQVFFSDYPDNQWDGTFNGKPVQQGVYIYKVQFTNPKRSKWYYFNGEIHLLR